MGCGKGLKSMNGQSGHVEWKEIKVHDQGKSTNGVERDLMGGEAHCRTARLFGRKGVILMT